MPMSVAPYLYLIRLRKPTFSSCLNYQLLLDSASDFQFYSNV